MVIARFLLLAVFALFAIALAGTLIDAAVTTGIRDRLLS